MPTDEPVRRRRGPPPTAACGTESGAQRHRRENTRICGPCRNAEAAARRNRRQQTKRKKTQ